MEAITCFSRFCPHCAQACPGPPRPTALLLLDPRLPPIRSLRQIPVEAPCAAVVFLESPCLALWGSGCISGREPGAAYADRLPCLIPSRHVCRVVYIVGAALCPPGGVGHGNSCKKNPSGRLTEGCLDSLCSGASLLV